MLCRNAGLMTCAATRTQGSSDSTAAHGSSRAWLISSGSRIVAILPPLRRTRPRSGRHRAIRFWWNSQKTLYQLFSRFLSLYLRALFVLYCIGNG
jgi:hypothetical protein